MRPAALLITPLIALLTTAASAEKPFVVASKLFNESVILGEVAAQLGRSAGHDITHERQLGGSNVLFTALQSGDVHMYPEYTGTLRQELLGELNLTSDAQLAAALAERGLRMAWPLGFNNTYAIGMRAERAAELGITTIGDLRHHPSLAYGFTNEFMDRGDGWPALRDAYALAPRNVSGMQHELAYAGIRAGSLDVMDLYSTDAEIQLYGLVALTDDLAFFPRYEAVLLYRAELETEAPKWIAAVNRLSGRITEPSMIAMNRRAKTEDTDESVIAADFLQSLEGFESAARDRAGLLGRLLKTTREHLVLTLLPLTAGALVAIPLGIAAASMPRFGQLILAVVGIGQTIPSLALLALFVPLVGIKQPPALIALFIYALLPMVRATQAGLASIPPSLIESARAIGLSRAATLRFVELPLASRSILSGIKTSAVITVGFATLGAFIGAGGYGEPILTGIRRSDFQTILEGAIPAALMALLAQTLFEFFERAIVPRGLRRNAT